MLDTVLMDGELLPLGEARVPVLDRGFLFGDSVYEVIAVYHGRAFLADRHLARLARSLEAIHCPTPHYEDEWVGLLEQVLRANQAQLGERAALYLQVTRGDQPQRTHAIPTDMQPRVLVMAMANPPVPPAAYEEGLDAVTVEDLRWRACHIKSTSLLGNVLAREQAAVAGAAEALLHRDGLLNEGASSNVLACFGDTLVTPPDGPDILPGVTRDWVLEQAAQAGVRCERRPIPVSTLGEADELWITSTTREVLPVTRLDGAPVGDGRPGPRWRAALRRYQGSTAP